MSFMNLRKRSLNLEGIMTVLKFTKGIRMTKTGIRHSADTECNEQRTETTGQNLRLFSVRLCEFSEGN
jgi:hypothetical protein